jgi:putative selenate reductase
MGYGYVVFGDFHFKDDLQFEDAVPMLKRLQEKADAEGLEFGVKMTNTFPVDVTRNELPSEEMYMSGRSLAALSLSVAHKLSKAFDGKLRISYSGGADYFNIAKIYSLGIWPITMATTYLKTGGYQRGNQIAEKLEKLEYKEFSEVNVEELGEFIKEVMTDKHYTKGLKPLPSRKLDGKVPLINCFTAPCNKQCPIEQDVPTYLKHVKDGEYLQALKVITDKNALPFITGTICSHTCMSKCTRNFYDESIKIRSAKLVAAQKGYDELIKEMKPSNKYNGKKVAVVGAGAAGIASAFFLAREGADVTVFEKRSEAGGIVRYIVPEFRIPREDVEKDVSLAKAMGAKFVFNHTVTDLNELREAGYEDIILAIGATKGMPLGIDCEREINAMAFLDTCRNHPESVTLGKNVAIIGAGNTAMDAARAAKRMSGVEHVYIVYRRTVKYMPADEEELELALHDGVEILELLAPVTHKNGKLICHKMALGEMDASGRQKPIETEEEVILDIDTVVASLGEKVDGSFYESLGLKVNKRGVAEYNPDTMESSVAHVYVTGDGANGPATVVEAIRDASKAVNSILDMKPRASIDNALRESEISEKKGVLAAAKEPKDEGTRCLECNKICEACVEVCPNRANVSIFVHGAKQPQILHIDYMCNECGNCQSFCPYDSAPYKEKFTLFRTMEDFEDSKNQGFVPLDMEKALFRVRLGDQTQDVDLKDIFCELHVEIKNLMLAVYHDHRYLMLQ